MMALVFVAGILTGGGAVAQSSTVDDARNELQAGFPSVLPVQEVARFYQLENKMDAEVDAQLALAVPLLE